ncbi:traI protein (DNA helicase I) [Acidisarcina polymorpha]|uniref:TraI protein (DNA helicase I) n=1 Tax=Acidisarcina polymorpha TaxID=2211140 RepID=A0A2Z5G3S0_9BACT|nr:MobF family relaxase [Acidisarcina polymorpha]AXC13823.1 traI protein (DNA helicase I) [Acidisarcina polymorpha]
MLQISKALSASKLQDYHKREFTSPDQNYWSQREQVQGQWQGQLAEKFGLSGAVGAEEFQRLSEGQHPYTAEQLVMHRQSFEYANADGKTVNSVQHRAGWDATFSPPKSVSLTALVGGDERIRTAHSEAVTIALTELERYTQARLGGNHPAETTGQFVVAKFEHDTARPVDGYAAPQLHTHAVIFNVTQRENGQTRALQEHGYFDSQQFATAVYQSELTYRLRNLGYEIEAGRSGAPEIKGYTLEYLDASSARRDQIRERMEKHGLHGYEAADIAAHASRSEKLMQTPAEVLAAHRHLAAEYGNQPDHVVAEAQERARIHTAERTHETVQKVAREAVTFARERSFEREAVTDERDLFRDALRRGMSEVTYTEVRANFETRIASGEFQLVPGEKHETGRQFTTAETIRTEKEILRQMQQGHGRAEQIMSIQAAVAHTEKQQHLNAGQRAAAEEILTSRDVVQGLEGRAGVGKTTLLKSVREAAETRGYVVEGFAPTSRAANQLREAGISADTLQGFLVRARQATADRHLYMVDESSLASTKQVRDFLTKLESGDRVLLIGDTRQHQGVEAGKPFEQLVKAGMKTAQLDQIVRQREAPELLRAVEHLSRGEIAEGVALLEQQGRVTEIADPQQRIAAIARSYAASPENTIVVSPDNASRRQINQAVRSELQALGAVASEGYAMRVLAPRSDMTGADRTWAARYAVDDVLYYPRGSQDIGIGRQSYTKVIATQSKNNLLTVLKEDGATVTYNPARLYGVNVYRELEREFAVGDRLGFTAPSKELGVANRDLGTVQHIDKGNQLSVKMDNGKSISFDANQMRHIDHGYAVTSHSSQGLTADRVLVNIDTRSHPELINTRFAYVSVSRAAQDAQIFTNDASKLATNLTNAVSKTSAIEVGTGFGI